MASQFVRVAHLNVRSLCPKINHIKHILQSENISVLGITETWLSNQIPTDLVEIEGYDFFRVDRGSRGGGVGIYVLSSLKPSIIFRENQINAHLENIWLSLHIFNIDIKIGVLYRPPNNNNLQASIQMIDMLLEEIIPTCDELVLLGDLNINLYNQNNASGLLTDLFESYNIKQLVTKPTRKTSLLDIFAVTNTDLVNSNILHYDMHDITDHQLILCDLKLVHSKPSSKFKTFRNFKVFNLDNFTCDLNRINWTTFYNTDDIDTKVKILNDKILQLFDVHAPLITRKISKPKAEWCTDVIKIMIKERNRCLTKYKHTKNESDWKVYTEIRNLVTDAIRQEKKAYLTHVRKNGSGKELWNTLKQLNIYNRSGKTLPDTFNNPNEINNYFIQSVEALNSDIHNDTLNYYLTHRISGNPNSFYFTHITDDMVINAMNSIKSNATGSDGLNLQMLKLCCPAIIPHLVHIFKLCVKHGYFSKYWKTAVVVPLPKIKNATELTQIRPISLLPVISKLFEKILASQIKDYIKERNLYPTTQSGFRTAHSTTTAMLKIVDDILEALDKGESTALILLDFSKAFDLVNHRLLDATLKYLNFSTKSRELLHSYLDDREQYVVLNNKKSTKLSISKGVPQGSILGPLLFILYTVDMAKIVNCTIHQFADDTQIYTSFKKGCADHAQAVLQSAVNNIAEYSINHGLKLNTDKSNQIIFGTHDVAVKEQLQISLNNDIIQNSETVKNLGFIMDSDMRFRKHVNMITQKGYNALRCLYRSKLFMDGSIKKMLCDSLVLSYANYGDVVYGPCLDQVNAYKIQKLQNSCIRFIHNINRREHCTGFINEIGWLKMENRRKQHLACLINKVISVETPKYLFDKLQFRFMYHKIPTRFNEHLTIPQHRTAAYERSFSFNSAKLYNSLPNHIKTENKSFKTRCKRHIFEQQISM